MHAQIVFPSHTMSLFILLFLHSDVACLCEATLRHLLTMMSVILQPQKWHSCCYPEKLPAPMELLHSFAAAWAGEAEGEDARKSRTTALKKLWQSLLQCQEAVATVDVACDFLRVLVALAEVPLFFTLFVVHSKTTSSSLGKFAGLSSAPLLSNSSVVSNSPKMSKPMPCCS